MLLLLVLALLGLLAVLLATATTCPVRLCIGILGGWIKRDEK